MKESLKPGIEHQLKFRIQRSKTVPALYPESQEFQEMPEVFASGFLVGLMEWACIRALHPYLDWPEEQTVGTHFDISHVAATPAGFEVLMEVKLIEVDGKRLVFEVEAHDGVDMISKGTHERFVIKKSRFDEKIKQKAVSIGG